MNRCGPFNIYFAAFACDALFAAHSMILAYHSIFSFYGFWLPNDPRGSGSDYIAIWDLFRFGPATKVTTRRSVAARPRNPNWKPAANRTLESNPVELNGRQALAVIAGFRQAIEEAKYAVHACAIMPDHVHLVLGRHPRDIRQAIGHFKSRGTHHLRASIDWTHSKQPIWGEHGWNVALNSAMAVERAIKYVERNPLKEGKKRQRWDFVIRFDESAARTVRRDAAQRKIGGAARQSHELKLSRDKTLREELVASERG